MARPPTTTLRALPVHACDAHDAPRLSAAARKIVERLEFLQGPSPAAPVDSEGLGRLMRANEGLRGKVLLQVLLALKASQRWQLAIALCALLEASNAEMDGGIDEKEGGDGRAFSDEDDNTTSDGADPMAALLGMDSDGAGGAKGGADDGLDGLRVDTMHYNVVIATCARARRWHEALRLLTRMRDRGVERDQVTYNTVLSALERGGRSKLAIRLFKQMRSEGTPLLGSMRAFAAASRSTV